MRRTNTYKMETEVLSSTTHKCVLIVDNAQHTGIVANIASVLSMTLGCKVDNIVSHDVYDKQGEKHLGITQLPIPILGASKEKIKDIRKHLLSSGVSDLVLVDFSTIAQHSKTYNEYEEAMLQAADEDLQYIGIGVCAPKKIVNKATGNLSLIR